MGPPTHVFQSDSHSITPLLTVTKMAARRNPCECVRPDLGIYWFARLSLSKQKWNQMCNWPTSQRNSYPTSAVPVRAKYWHPLMSGEAYPVVLWARPSGSLQQRPSSPGRAAVTASVGGIVSRPAEYLYVPSRPVLSQGRVACRGPLPNRPSWRRGEVWQDLYPDEL